MISEQDVKKVAKLSRLGITEKENKKFQKEISSILNYFEMIKKTDVSEISPAFHPTEKFLKGNVLRKDESVLSKTSSEKLIEAAPDKKGRYLKVKAVL